MYFFQIFKEQGTFTQSGTVIKTRTSEENSRTVNGSLVENVHPFLAVACEEDDETHSQKIVNLDKAVNEQDSREQPDEDPADHHFDRRDLPREKERGERKALFTLQPRSDDFGKSVGRRDTSHLSLSIRLGGLIAFLGVSFPFNEERDPGHVVSAARLNSF